MTPAEIDRAIVAATARLKLAGVPHADAEQQAIAEIARQTKTKMSALPRPRPVAPSPFRFDAAWLVEHLMRPLRPLIGQPAQRAASPPPPSPPPERSPQAQGCDAHFYSGRGGTRGAKGASRPRAVPSPTPDRAAQPPGTPVRPLLLAVAGAREPHRIDNEFENDARFRDRTSANWRADQQRDWR